MLKPLMLGACLLTLAGCGTPPPPAWATMNPKFGPAPVPSQVCGTQTLQNPVVMIISFRLYHSTMAELKQQLRARTAGYTVSCIRVAGIVTFKAYGTKNINRK